MGRVILMLVRGVCDTTPESGRERRGDYMTGKQFDEVHEISKRFEVVTEVQRQFEDQGSDDKTADRKQNEHRQHSHIT